MNILDFNKQNADASFKKLMNHKGEIAPIAEKANANLQAKQNNKTTKNQRIHYFAIGHKFKQLDTEAIFKMELDEETRKKLPSTNSSLQLRFFDETFVSGLNSLANTVRNINSHYVHVFDVIKLDSIKVKDSLKIQQFLKESFELAVIEVYLAELNDRNIKNGKLPVKYAEFIASESKNTNIIDFLAKKFFSLDKEHEKNEKNLEWVNQFIDGRNFFKSFTSIEQAIDALLFVDVAEDKDWILNDTHKVFTISQGKYLSFYGCLFLLSLFLYKDEANQLISKIKGFKRNGNKEEQSKRDIFTFFSKKFSSQDIDSEENSLIKFRDIVQYLSKYPVEWSRKLELTSDVPLFTEKLKDKIIEMEIDRAYPIDKNQREDNARFHLYTRIHVWKESIEISFSESEKKNFDYILFKSDEFKDAEKKLKELNIKLQKRWNSKVKDKISDTERKIKSQASKPNRTTEKLKERIKNNSLYMSYGRNQDRFMSFAMRYLAEINYFGKDTHFKLYQFYDTQQQDNYLNSFELPRQKKEYDAIPFHQGQVTRFCSWQQHHSEYPEWDTPFVVENNALQLEMTLGNQLKTVNIQRALLVYLLQHALTVTKPENTGKSLLKEYFTEHHTEFEEKKSVLASAQSIDAELKGSYKKLFPKRLIDRYVDKQPSNEPNKSSLKHILIQAEKAMERYESLLKKAESNNTKEDFIKRNKGKQFKLQFVRKAWNLMFFRDQYFEQLDAAGEHHKQFHITRDEFNDFCRYLFAFDQIPAYKLYLKEMLESKGFLNNETFSAMFEKATSLDNLFEDTIALYVKWLDNPPLKQVEANKYTLSRYDKILDNKMFYINLSHFINFPLLKKVLDPENTAKLHFPALDNKPYLIDNFYPNQIPGKGTDDYKTYKKMFNELQTSRLEDCLLYEIAIHYLTLANSTDKSKLKANILSIQQQDIAFEMKDQNQQSLFELVVPFKDIDKYTGVVKLRKSGTDYWEKLIAYMLTVKDHKHIKAVYDEYQRKGQISLDNLNKLYGYFVGKAIGFSKLSLALEEYFIVKDAIHIPDDKGRIEYENIVSLRAYYTDKERNNAFHFDIQDKTYEQLMKEIETRFYTNEVRPHRFTNFQNISQPQRKIGNLLLDTLHNEYFEKRINGKKLDREQAQDSYFKEVIARN